MWAGAQQPFVVISVQRAPFDSPPLVFELPRDATLGHLRDAFEARIAGEGERRVNW
jgi:hypothetical protein